MPAVYLLVFDGFADWEPAYALAELRRSGGPDVATVGFSDTPVRSMGGVRVMPDIALADLDPGRVRRYHVFKHGRFPQPSEQPG